MPPMKLWTILRFLNVLVFMGLIAYLIRRYSLTHFSPELVRDLVRGYGALAPVVFIVMYAFVPLVFLPASLLTAAAAILWSWNWALLFAVVGNNLCANLGFWIARTVGQERVQKLARGRLNGYDKKLEDGGIKSVALLRLVPVMPFTTLSYGAGFSKMRWRDFVVGHFIGTLPGTALFILLLELVV